MRKAGRADRSIPTRKPFAAGQDGDPPKAMMLFDLENDPSEQHDVAVQNPEVVKRLKAMFDQLNAQVPEFPPIDPR